MTTSIDDVFRAAIRLHRQGRAAEAGRGYDLVLGRVPDHPGALHLKGVIALQAARYDEAVALIERSLSILPRQAQALSNLGVAYRAKGRMTDAIRVLEQAVTVDTRSADAWVNLAQTQDRCGMMREAVASARRAMELAPDRLGARGLMLFAANNLAEVDPLVLAAEARRYGEIAERLVPARLAHNNDRDPDRVLRVGLVSGDFKAHPVGRFLDAVLAEMDPTQVSLYTYSDVAGPDEITRRLRSHMAVWRETKDLSDGALGEAIVADGIDVAVDLSGHSGAVRLQTFAGRPAPVSFTWLGYFATTGLTTIDYVLANRWVIPPSEEGQWSERVWRMPDTYLCFSTPPDPPEVGPLPALATGSVTFGCFNNFNKLSERTLGAWSRLLAAVPGSRLILRSSGKYHEGTVDNLRRRLISADLDVGRVRIDDQIKDYAAHLASYREIDIALDPFPYNGGTTTVEALYMGVPVLVRAGDRYVAHMGESILHNAGLPDWIAPDEDHYAELGAAKAADLAGLAELRAGLRQRMIHSPLFDAPRFARNFEGAIRGMWQAWCASQSEA